MNEKELVEYFDKHVKTLRLEPDCKLSIMTALELGLQPESLVENFDRIYKICQNRENEAFEQLQKTKADQYRTFLEQLKIEFLKSFAIFCEGKSVDGFEIECSRCKGKVNVWDRYISRLQWGVNVPIRTQLADFLPQRQILSCKCFDGRLAFEIRRI